MELLQKHTNMGVMVKEKGHVTSKRELLMLGGRKERVMGLLQNAPLCLGPGNERKKERGTRKEAHWCPEMWLFPNED